MDISCAAVNARLKQRFRTTVGLFLALGVASVLFWLYFQVRREPEQPAAT